jgi:amino acid adenylation domain-containing protein
MTAERVPDRRLENLTPAQRALLEQRLMARRAAVARENTIPRREVLSPCELSYSQELLWLLSQVFDDGVAYNAPSTFHLDGPLDLELLHRALAALIARHEILRTSYAVIDGRPMQFVGEPFAVELNVVDVSSLPAEERESEVQRVLKDESRYRFDLERGPVLRPTVIRLGANEHVLMLNIHHIATDGYSRTALMRDLTAFYDALRDGAQAELPVLPIQYADFAVWHRHWLDGGVADRQLEYWKRKLGGAPSRLDLPSDFPRPPVRSYVGDHMSLMHDMATRDGLSEAGRRNGGTMFTAVLALFATLLSRYSSQDDVVIGTPYAGRNRTELDSMVGYFINPLPLRIDLSGDPTFDELVVRVRDTTQEAFANADVPYEMVVRATNPERDLSQTPVFQAMIVYHNPAYKDQRPKFEPRGLRCTEISHEKGWSKFDVLLGVSERKTGMNTTFEYSTELFKPATVARMMEHMKALGESVATGSDRRLSKLSMLSESDRTKVVTGWNPRPSEVPEISSIKELFEAQVKATPEAEAVVLGEERLSYEELNRRANAIAWMLIDRGVGPGTLVGITMEKSPELVATVLAVWKAGAAYVPVDPAYPEDRIEFMLADARPKLLLSHRRLEPRRTATEAEVVFVDDVADTPRDDPPTVSGPDDLAYIIYTSGSTGQPKGAMITLGGLCSVFRSYEREYRLRDLKAHAQMASFSFDVFTGDVIRALLAGAKVVLCPVDVVLDPGRLYELWAREGVDAVELVPATATLLFEYAEREGKRLDFMRFIAIGGEAWRTDKYVQFRALCGPQTRLVNSYGLTEATMDSTYFEPAAGEELLPGRFMPIGRPIPNSRVYVLDPHLQPQPVGIPGELCIGGQGISRGYLNRPELTAERFVEDPFVPGGRMYRTGDLARWLPDGTVEFVGRRDRQLKIRGFRVEPGEIESVLERHPAVRAAAVVDYEVEPGDVRLVAYLEAGEREPDPGDVRSFVSEHVPGYMIPSSFVVLERLPLNPNGKVDRRALPEPEWDRSTVSDEFIEAETDLERSLAEIWQELLGVERVGMNDNFFELGGHSLLAVRLAHVIEERLARTCSLAMIFRTGTVRGLAEEMQAGGSENRAATILKLQPKGEHPALFCVCGVHAFQELADQLAPHIPVYGVFLPVEQDLFNLERSERVTEISVEAMAAGYVEAIRQRQASGPYLLLGFCFGGTVAYEMARQLEAAGEEVSLVVMLDTTAKSGIQRRKSQLVMRRVKRQLILMRHDAADAVRKRFGVSITSAGLSDTERLEHMRMRLYGAAARGYEPSARAGQTVVIRSEHMISSRAKHLVDNTYGWARYASDLAVYDIAGDHLTHLKAPHVRELAEALRPHLERARNHRNGSH